jgi:tRNA-splicing endonuclease subunit Sen2
MTLQQIWNAFQNAHSYPLLPPISPSPNRFDNPFLVNYVVYHHYRSLGWVIKGGIKFCVDYLLYKRGPVFHHAESVSNHL